MPEDKKWLDVLEAFYNDPRGKYSWIRPEEENVQDFDLNSDVELELDEIQNSIDYCINAGLIDWDFDSSEYQLTEKGFQVMHDREMERKNQALNENLAFFTLLIVFVTGAGSLIPSEFQAEKVAIFIVILAATVVFQFVQLKRYRG